MLSTLSILYSLLFLYSAYRYLSSLPLPHFLVLLHTLLFLFLSLPPLSVWMHMYPYIFMCEWGCIYAHMRSQRTISFVSLHLPPCLPVSSHGSPVSICRHTIGTDMHYFVSLHGFWGFKLGFLCLDSKHLTHSAISLVPLLNCNLLYH